MSEHVTRQKLTDDDVCAILLAPPEVTNDTLAEQVGCSWHVVRHYRKRHSYRAIRLAEELGLIDRAPNAVRGFALGGLA